MNGFENYLSQTARIPGNQLPFFEKWVQSAYGHAGSRPDRYLTKPEESAFFTELSHGHEEWQIRQARQALALYRLWLEGWRPSASPSASDKACWKEKSEQMKARLRLQHKSYRTEQTYLGWLRRFYLFVDGKTPDSLAADDVRRFLSHLAVDQRVAPSTQNQALNALLFFFRHVLEREMGDVSQSVRARPSKRLPVVLTKTEVQALLSRLDGVPYLMAALTYGGGLRVAECARLRVKDVDLERKAVTVRAGKGIKS